MWRKQKKCVVIFGSEVKAHRGVMMTHPEQEVNVYKRTFMYLPEQLLLKSESSRRGFVLLSV